MHDIVAIVGDGYPSEVKSNTGHGQYEVVVAVGAALAISVWSDGGFGGQMEGGLPMRGALVYVSMHADMLPEEEEEAARVVYGAGRGGIWALSTS